MLLMYLLYFSSFISHPFSRFYRKNRLFCTETPRICCCQSSRVWALSPVGLGKFLEWHLHDSSPLPSRGDGGADSPSSWLAEEVVRLNCCSRYFPKKAAKPATTAISMQAARMMQVNTGFDSRCLVTFGITAGRQKQRVTHCTSRPPAPESLPDTRLPISVNSIGSHPVAQAET